MSEKEYFFKIATSRADKQGPQNGFFFLGQVDLFPLVAASHGYKPLLKNTTVIQLYFISMICSWGKMLFRVSSVISNSIWCSKHCTGERWMRHVLSLSPKVVYRCPTCTLYLHYGFLLTVSPRGCIYYDYVHCKGLILRIGLSTNQKPN